MCGIFFRKTLKPFVKSYGNYFRKHVHMYGIFVRLTLLHLKFFQFKMAALNKRVLLAAMLIILRRGRRRRIKKNKANFKKRLWIRPTNADRLNSGAFYSTFIVLKSLDRCEFFRSVVLNFFNLIWLRPCKHKSKLIINKSMTKIFRTLLYSESWDIQNQRHIQNPGISKNSGTFRTRHIFRICRHTRNLVKHL